LVRTWFRRPCFLRHPQKYGKLSDRNHGEEKVHGKMGRTLIEIIGKSFEYANQKQL